MTKDPLSLSLIDSIRAEIKRGVLYPQGFEQGIERAIAIIRQHEADNGVCLSGDSSLKGTAKSIPCKSEAPTNASEIPAVDEGTLFALISNIFCELDYKGDMRSRIADVLRPYLRTTEPVFKGDGLDLMPTLCGTKSSEQPVGSSEALRLLNLIDKAVEGYIVEHERVANGNDEPGYSLKVWGSDRANLVAASKSHIPLLRELLKSPKRELGEIEEIICEMVKGDGFRILESSDCRAFGEEKGLTIQMYRPDWQFGVMSKLVEKLRKLYRIEGGKP